MTFYFSSPKFCPENILEIISWNQSQSLFFWPQISIYRYDCLNQNCFPERQKFYITIITIMRNGLPNNPFLRNNPFHIPQKFYSQSHFQQNTSLNDSTNKYGNFPKITIETKENVSYGEIIKHTILLKKERQQLENTQKLTKKGLIKRQSPFTRKNLLQNNYLKVQNTVERAQYLGITKETGEIQSRRQRVMRQNRKAPEQVIKSPTKNQFQICQEMSSPSKQKYLASELKIKLRSQTCLDQSPQQPLTEQKTNKMKGSIYYPPKFKWKGREFFLRQIN